MPALTRSFLRWSLPVLTLAAAPVWAQGVLKIGEINSYKAMPAFLEPYKKGMDLAVEQINASGGLLGKKVQLVIRDDNGNPGDAVRAAEELYTREKVDVLTSSFLSHVGMALTDYAGQKKRFFLESETLTPDILARSDVLYCTRVQKERFPNEAEYEKVKNSYRVDNAALKHAKSSTVVLHPLPRNEEVAEEVDFDQRAAYFRQVCS
mgnify:CR=1 FL=1